MIPRLKNSWTNAICITCFIVVSGLDEVLYTYVSVIFMKLSVF